MAAVDFELVAVEYEVVLEDVHLPLQLEAARQGQLGHPNFFFFKKKRNFKSFGKNFF